jgi:uncharacterized protein
MCVFDVVIYHKNCIDGFSSYVVALTSGKISKNHIVYPDVPSAHHPPPNIYGKNVLIMDVAYRKDILKEIFEKAKKVVFIDHHLSIADDSMDIVSNFGKNDDIVLVYDEKKSGATLTWNYFFKDKKIPLFLRFIEDQDTGKWEFNNTRSFIFALKTYYDTTPNEKTLNKWKNLFDKMNVAKLVKKGEHMKDYNDYLAKINLGKHSRKFFPSEKIFEMGKNIFSKVGQYDVAVFNGAQCPSVTELSILALERLKCDICIFWNLNIDKNEYVISMRSINVDVSEICKKFGGGGHKLAAACSFDGKKYNIRELFINNPTRKNKI